MKKAVAIPYVIALILGVIVVGILGYWFIAQGGKTIGKGKGSECDSLCAAWRNSGFGLKPSNIKEVCSGSEDTIQMKDFCMTRLGCKAESPSCTGGRIDYGSTPTGSRYCCP